MTITGKGIPYPPEMCGWGDARETLCQSSLDLSGPGWTSLIDQERACVQSSWALDTISSLLTAPGL